ncbi:MAG: DNA topoisomerase I [Flavobacteriaceae bacterium]|nr:DNA topoisomerase I [Flavobacteriaceae bacterium]|tara:strand:- start:9699 stop:12164 length:2466 start_codon:yes stop_codon:yes gene_type:complete
MADNLVIVESPAKAKTIEKFLGSNFKVASSFGHISDLPSKNIGIDVNDNFKPSYEISTDKKSIVKKLRDLAKKSKTVWLASDEDREGEAIAWHLFRTLKLDENSTKRIVFNEITKSAITHAISNPRSINYNLVDAQQARRILDRIVGYELSPVLWRKVKGGLSAGRVQSVAVRLLVEKEREIRNHESLSKFRVEGIFENSNNKDFTAKFSKEFNSKDEAENFLKSMIGTSFNVSEISKKPLTKSAPAPFTTSTLQQEASRKLSFPVGKTMSTAQRLYESGHITYMRTDSVNLSSLALEEAKKKVISLFGESYSNPKNYNTKSKSAQQAHEAVRPTNFSISPESISDYDQKRLYNLILNRTLASQMMPAKLEKTNIKISNSKNDDLFYASGQVIKFDGYLKLYQVSKDDSANEEDGILPNFTEKEVLNMKNLYSLQKFSRPPYRYSEASLVKKLEELGIGRPSTYAPTISTIQNRKYVDKGSTEPKVRDLIKLSIIDNKIKEEKLTEKFGSDKGKLIPTDIGMIVTDFLINHFKNIMDYNFTARVEEDFDSIADGKKEWTEMMKNFYDNFHPIVEDVQKNATRESGKRVLGMHPESGKEISVRLGKFGPMVQIGTVEDEEKPKFASLPLDLQIESVSLDEALLLFQLPRDIGKVNGEMVVANNGRYGPYIKFGKKFISIPIGKSPTSISLNEAKILIDEKQKADAPIHIYENMDVQKGKGKFGPYIKWNNMFINVGKNYDWDNLSKEEIEELIEDKKRKEREKIIHNWEDEGIKIEKGRWGKFYLVKSNKRILLDKNLDVESLDLTKAKELYQANSPKKTKK